MKRIWYPPGVTPIWLRPNLMHAEVNRWIESNVNKPSKTADGSSSASSSNTRSKNDA